MKFLPGKTVGIDLGTTYSALAYLDESGQPVTVPNREGGLITPSAVWVGSGEGVLVGPRAIQAAAEHPDEVAQGIKRYMGDRRRRIPVGDIALRPEVLSAMILRKLKGDAEQRIGPIANAVITVPAYFNDTRRRATLDAGRIAGLNVLEIINEPTAATLAYAWSTGQLGRQAEADRPQTVIVYDLGGGTFDVTAVRFQGTEFRVLATDGDVRLGGMDWTRRLAEYAAERIAEQGGPDIREDQVQWERLVQRCEAAKRQLSARPHANVQLKIGERNYIVEVSRERFEELTADLLQRTRDTIEAVLDEAGLSPQQVDRFILVGGSTRMPAVIRLVRDLAGSEPYTDLSPDEAVAHGAAIHASILEAKHRGEAVPVPAELADRLRSVKQVNVNSHSLGVVARDPATGRDVNAIMIPRNTPIPATRTERFLTQVDGQRMVKIMILEGDAPDPDACTLIGQCTIADLPKGLPAGSPIEVTYSFDENGCIQVRARDLTGGREARIELLRGANLETREVDEMGRMVSALSVK